MGENARDMSLREMLLVTDIDGTLVTDKGMIPQRNVEAIERFVKKGGRFAFATGRSVLGSEKYAARVPLNVPSIVYNGGGIYDFAEKRMLWNRFLPKSYADIVMEVRERFPDIGVEVYSGGQVYYLNMNEYSKAHMAFQGISSAKRAEEDELPDSNKVLFCGDEKRLRELSEHLERVGHEGCACVFSGPFYFELLPEGISKGVAVAVLSDILGIPLDRVVSIGDYYNDAELLAVSAVGAVPAGAPDDLKQAADIVLGPCEGGAVADFIEYLEELCGGRE